MLRLLWQKFGMTIKFPGATGNAVVNKRASLAAGGVKHCMQMVLAALRRQNRLILTFQATLISRRTLLTSPLKRKKEGEEARNKQEFLPATMKQIKTKFRFKKEDTCSFSDHHSNPALSSWPLLCICFLGWGSFNKNKKCYLEAYLELQATRFFRRKFKWCKED